jgi:hypothetical protein
MKFKVGDRVILPANLEEGWSEERGKIIGDDNIDNDVVMVEIDRRFRTSELDDGLREVYIKYVNLQKEE